MHDYSVSPVDALTDDIRGGLGLGTRLTIYVIPTHLFHAGAYVDLDRKPPSNWNRPEYFDISFYI